MWPNPQFSADLVIFIEEIINRNFDFLCSGLSSSFMTLSDNYDETFWEIE